MNTNSSLMTPRPVPPPPVDDDDTGDVEPRHMYAHMVEDAITAMRTCPEAAPLLARMFVVIPRGLTVGMVAKRGAG